MHDILLTEDGDIAIGEDGDISITTSIRQAARIRLQWFLAEWRFAPRFGIPYFEEVLVKNPNQELVRRIIRDELIAINGIRDVVNLTLTIDNATRRGLLRFTMVTDIGRFQEEVELGA